MVATDPNANGLGFDLLAKIHLAIGEQTRAVRQLHERLNRPPAQPITFPIIGNKTTPVAATYPVVIKLGGPSQGKTWDVRQLSISGLTPISVIGGVADVFVRGDDPPAQATYAQIGVTGWRDQAVALPLVAYYAKGQIHVPAGQKLLIVLSGYTVATEYIVQGEVEQSDDAAFVQVVSR